MRFDFARRIKMETLRPVMFCWYLILRSLVSSTSHRPSANARSSPFFFEPYPALRTVWHSWPMAPTLSFSSSGRHSSMRIFISRSGPTGEFWLLPTRQWLARGLRPGIASEIHLAFLHPPNSQAGSGKGRVCHGKRVLRCGCRDLGQLRFERWSPSGSSWSKVNYLISPEKVFRKAQSPSKPSAFRKSHKYRCWRLWCYLERIGDFQSKGNFPSVPRHSPPAQP